jgi:O-methyltransferase involved in polyketide biosynthesis
MTDKISPALFDVAETLLIPLHIRAKETQRPDALLKDEKAIEMVQRISYDFSKIKLQGHDELGLILRVREFDRFTRDFLAAHPDGLVVHIGCGLDTRFERVDNGTVEWYDLDLPEVIALRRKLIREEGGRYHLLSCSVFDPAWIERLSTYRSRPFLFIGEGVFPYFEEQQIKSLVLKLQATFPDAELVFDAQVPWVMHADNFQLLFSGVKARMQFALKDARDVETWGVSSTSPRAGGIRMLEEWYYFGTDEPRVRKYRWMYKIKSLRKTVGIFHYRLGNQP